MNAATAAALKLVSDMHAGAAGAKEGGYVSVLRDQLLTVCAIAKEALEDQAPKAPDSAE